MIEDLDLSPYGNSLPNLRALVRRNVSYPDAVMADSPEVYYRFESAPGILADSSGNGYTLTATAGTLSQTTGRHGQGLANQATLYQSRNVAGNVAALQSDQFSVEFWMQYKGGAPSGGVQTNRFRYVNPANSNSPWHVLYQPNVLLNQINIITRLFNFLAGPVDVHTYAMTRDTNWHHVVWTYDSAGSSILYVDKVAVSTVAAPYNPLGMVMGGTSELNVEGFDMKTDENAYYSHVLSAETVAFHYDLGMWLRFIVEEVSEAAGLEADELDLTAASHVVRGLVLDQRVEARSFLQTVVPLFFVDLVEVDGVIRAVRRGGASVATLDVSEFGAVDLMPGESESEPPVRLPGTRKQDYELPQAVEVAYFDVLTQEPGHQQAFRVSKSHVDEVLTIQTALVMSAGEARQVALRFLWSAWAEQMGWEGQTLPNRMVLHPADVVTLVQDNVQYRCRVEGQGLVLPGSVRLKLVEEEVEALLQLATGQDPIVGFEPFVVTAGSQLVAWSGNSAFEEDALTVGFYWAAAPEAAASLWPGADLHWSTDAGASYQLIDSSSQEGTFGATTTVLAAGTTTGVWDTVNTVDVTLAAGATDRPPETRTDAEVLGGENGVVIGDEYVRFAVATSLGGDSYRLSRLLRGQRGTDAFWNDHRIGDRVVFADGSARRVEVPLDMNGTRVLLKLLGSGETLADVSPVNLTLYGRELLAWSGAQLTGSRDGPLNLTIDWVRRARLDNELQPYQDVPLDFDTEAYAIKLPRLTSYTVTGVSQAVQAVVSAAAHPFSIGDEVILTDIDGMTPLNNRTVMVVAADFATFTISEDTRDFPAYTANGTARGVVRTITASTSTAVYSAADQSTDYFAPQSSVEVFIYQLNNQAVKGHVLTGTV